MIADLGIVEKSVPSTFGSGNRAKLLVHYLLLVDRVPPEDPASSPGRDGFVQVLVDDAVAHALRLPDSRSRSTSNSRE